MCKCYVSEWKYVSRKIEGEGARHRTGEWAVCIQFPFPEPTTGCDEDLLNSWLFMRVSANW